MNDIAPGFRLLELIDQHFEERKKPWVGKASELETELTGELSNVSAQAYTEVRNTPYCPTIVPSYTLVCRSATVWVIWDPYGFGKSPRGSKGLCVF